MEILRETMNKQRSCSENLEERKTNSTKYMEPKLLWGGHINDEKIDEDFNDNVLEPDSPIPKVASVSSRIIYFENVEGREDYEKKQMESGKAPPRLRNSPIVS
jgi:hypothetical protein